MTRIRRPLILAAVLAAAASLAAAGCSDGETALMRGDRLWADSQYTDALAEYRLALRQSGGAEGPLLRVAHAYAHARNADFDQTHEHYRQLLSRSPEYEAQAVHDYIALANRARDRGDQYGMARAVEAALELEPDLPLPDLNEAMATYYLDAGDTDRALAFYRRALVQASPDPSRRLLFRIGELHESRDDCAQALDFFRAYRLQAPRGPHATEAAWYEGNCAFRLGREAHGAGRLTSAMDYFETVVELGVPETAQEEAWFKRGEILFALGEFERALESYRRVMEMNRRGTGRWADPAQQRIDQIRFRR